MLDRDLQTMVSNKLYNGQPNEKLEKPATVRKVAKDSEKWFEIKGHIQLGGKWKRDPLPIGLTNDPNLVHTPHTQLRDKEAAGGIVLADRMKEPTF